MSLYDNKNRWYSGTFACGHEGSVSVIGPRRDGQWIADRKFDEICSDCYKKQIEEKNAEATEKAKEMELPELTGSDKQVGWANSLRLKLIDQLSSLLDNESEILSTTDRYGLNGLDKEEIIKFMDYILNNKTSARFYIDNRNLDMEQYIKEYSEEVFKSDEDRLEEKYIELLIEEKKESIVYPDDMIADLPVEVDVNENTIEVKYERNKELITIVRGLGYSWNGSVWCRDIKPKNGTIQDRIAELGNKLLNYGFPVIILDKETREKAIKGDYEHECKRWIEYISAGKDKEKLKLKWDGYDVRLYDLSKRLPGAKWDSGMVVRINHIEKIEGFAKTHGFKFSKAAKEAIEIYREGLIDVKGVQPVLVEK